MCVCNVCVYVCVDMMCVRVRACRCVCVFYTVLVEVIELSGITSLSNGSSGDGSEAIRLSDTHFYPLRHLTPPVSRFCVDPLGFEPRSSCV